MKDQSTKKINQTFSIPLEISQELHTYIKRREMSHFVSEAIRKELDTKKKELRQAYLMANKDKGQREAIENWEDSLEDGLNE